MNSTALATTKQRKSLEALGLALPFHVWLFLFVAYMAGVGILIFVHADSPTIRGLALAVNMFIMGIFCAFKFPLWVSKR